MVSFEDPRWLWALAVAVPLAVVGLRWFVAMSGLRRWSAVLVRAVLSALIVALLAGASSVREVDRLAVVAVVDVSESVSRFGGTDAATIASEWLETATADRGPDDLLGVVTFDGRAITIATPSGANVLERSLGGSGIEGSDLSGALRTAAGLVPPDAAGRLVVFSDGNATGGDAVGAARALAQGTRSASGDGAGGLGVDVVPIEYRVENEVIVEQVDAPPRAAGESTVLVRVVLRSTGPTEGTLRLFREGEPVDATPGEEGTGRRVRVPAGRTVELIEAKLDGARLHRFEAVFEPDDPASDLVRINNTGKALTVTPGRGSVLLIDGVSEGDANGPGRVLANALERQGIGVNVVGTAGAPAGLLELQGYDLVILQNVPAEAIPEPAQAQLVSYVRDLGGGLLMVGGPQSFGAGGWRGSTLEPVLPVNLDIPEELIVPEAAIVFVLDNSGSMARGVQGSARTQQEIANEAAARAVLTLDPQDRVGVIAFNSSPQVIHELSVNDDPARTAAKTRAIPSGGGTSIGPAVQIARDQLRRVDAKLKHVIVLTDGRSNDPMPLPELARSMRTEDNILVTTIAVGDGADSRTLSAMADAGGGAFFNVVNPNVLPRVFLKAVRVVRSPLVREVPFDVAMLPTGSPLTAGVAQPPRLEGLVLTQARDEPTITYAMASPEAEPVLAHWPVELGQVGVFTSDAHRWARRWLDWDGYSAFWAQVVRGLSRTDSGEGGELRTLLTPEGLRVRYSAYTDEGDPIDLLTVPATVFDPDGGQRDIVLTQTGPGEYEALERADAGGTYVVVARPRLGQTPLRPVVGGASVSSGAEFRALESDRGLLERIAAETGGRVLRLDTPGEVDLFDRTGVPPREASSPLWPVLLVWTLAVFLLDVGTRRVAWDRLIGDEYGDRATRRALAARSADASDRLRAAKASVGKRVGASPGVGRGPGDSLRSSAASGGASGGARAKAGGSEASLRSASASKGEAATRPAEPGKPAKATPKREVSDGAAGLLAAKRRARQQMDED
ncbi:MAG: VWA domain-containing protein [Planctomycetota bacterium]